MQHSQRLHLQVLEFLSEIVRNLNVAEHKDLALDPEPECPEYQKKLCHFYLGVLEGLAQDCELFAISATVSLGWPGWRRKAASLTSNTGLLLLISRAQARQPPWWDDLVLMEE